MIQDYILEQFKEYANKNDVEVCGLITLCKKDMIQYLHIIKNISDYKKEIDYMMDPQEVFDILKNTKILNKNSDYELLSVIHSHPNGIEKPSMVDIKRKAYNVCYTIYSKITKQFGFWELNPETEEYKKWNFKKVI